MEKITGQKANPVYIAISKEKHMERDRKRKATDQAQKSHFDRKRQKRTDNSVQAQRDNARHDGISVSDIASDVPQILLEDLMTKYYEAHVQVSSSKAKGLDSATKTQGERDGTASNIWKAEKHKRITSIVGQIAKRKMLYRGISSKYENYYIKLNNRLTQIKMVRSL